MGDRDRAVVTQGRQGRREGQNERLKGESKVSSEIEGQ